MGGPPYWSVVEDLVKLLRQHHQYDNLQKAVEQAVAYNIAELKKIGNVDRESFLDCMDFLVRTWIPSEDLEGKDVYYRLIIHYSIFDQPVLKIFSHLSSLPRLTGLYLGSRPGWCNTQKRWGNSLTKKALSLLNPSRPFLSPLYTT